MTAETNSFCVMDDSFLDQRIKDALGKYVRNTTLKNITYSIVKGNDYAFTMYATYYFVEETMEINDLEIVVNQVRKNDPHLEIEICHELGHLENASQAVLARNKRILEPTNWLQKLRVEIMADGKAAKIYGSPKGKKIVNHWLKNEMIYYVRHYKKALNKKAIAHSFVLFLIRYIFNVFFSQESRWARGAHVEKSTSATP
jgi:hypothetical protein